MTELSVLSVKRGTTNVNLVNKTESLKTSFCPWRVLEKSLNFVCLKLYEPWFKNKDGCSLCSIPTIKQENRELCTVYLWYRPGARFSKVPKLYGPFLGVAIPFVSQERRGFLKGVKLHCHLDFCYLENMSKGRFSKTSGCQVHKWLFGPEKFSGLSRNGPQRRNE